MTKRRIFLRSATILFCVFMLLCAVVFPAEAAESIMSSLSLAVRRVVPSLSDCSAAAARAMCPFPCNLSSHVCRL